MRDEHTPHVVIVGGGFGGLYAARALRGAPVRVTLVDRRNHHLFQPLLYQVATATLSPSDIARPIRDVLRRQRNAEVLLAEVEAVDAGAREIVLTDGRRLAYDHLILAAGAIDRYFGHDAWARWAPPLKSVTDAVEIRRRFLLAFELAEQEPDPARRRALLTFVVVGGGPTGVETAGAFAEIARHTLRRDFRRIDPGQARIVLLEGGPRLLAGHAEPLAARARRDLERLGVEVRLGALVTDIGPDGVTVGDERIFAGNVVWAAGVGASPLGRTLGAAVDGVGRVLVEPDLSVPGHPEIFVIGDLAHVARDGRPLPGVAQVAIQSGRAAARNIVRTLQGRPRVPFRYRDRGSMAVIGRGRAVAEIGRMRFTGALAWWVWAVVHILFLIGFRNRVAVAAAWAWAYVTWRREARLITGGEPPRRLPSDERPRGAAEEVHPG